MWLIITVHIAILQWAYAQNLPTVPIDYFNGKYNLYWTPEYHCP